MPSAQRFTEKLPQGGRAGIEVEGAAELRRAFRRMEANLGDIRDIHRSAAETVLSTAEGLVPRLTGRLGRTLRISARNIAAAVVAGRQLVPYAGPVHFGWHARNIEPQPFLYDALDQRRDEVIARYNDAVDTLIRKFDRDAPD